MLPDGEVAASDPSKDVSLGALRKGESAEVEVQFSTQGLLGKVVRRLIIHSSDPLKGILSVKMAVEVKRAFIFDPPILDFGEVSKGEVVRREVKIRSNGVGDFHSIRAVQMPPALSMSSRKLEGQAAPSQLMTFEFVAKGPSGVRRHNLKLKLKGEKMWSVDLMVFATILSDVRFKLEPEDRSGTLDLGRIKRDQGGQGSIEIKNTNQKLPLEIDSIRILSKHEAFIEWELQTLEAKTHYRLVLKIRPGMEGRFLQGVVAISCNHSDLKKKEIRFMGWIEDG
jgi:hypothetical protein